MHTILRVENVQKVYGSRGNITRALDDISLTVDEGEFIGVMGASGSGKTTLLNCISTIDTVTSGHLYVRDEDITQLKNRQLTKFRRDNLGFIFQDFNLLDTLTGYENVALALSIRSVPTRDIEKKVRAISDVLGISHVLERYPYQMSGGEKQRVASARALVADPALVLADEPTGALDSKSARVLLQSMARINELYRATILMVTHDPTAASYAGRIVFIKDGSVFSELVRGEDSRKQFFARIMDVMALLGGEIDHVS
jgi:putative ABC transport system ATP-binding protein